MAYIGGVGDFPQAGARGWAGQSLCPPQTEPTLETDLWLSVQLAHDF